MPHRDRGKGTLVIDVVTRVGRIKRASGTNDEAVLKKLKKMIRTLAGSTHAEYVRAIRDGQMSPLEVYALFRVHGAEKMPKMDAIQGLGAALDAWIKDAECGERHRAAHRTMRKRVMEKAKPDAEVADLPTLLEAVRTRYKARKMPSAFNRIRASALSFARDTLRRSHPIYGELIEVPVLKERKLRENNPQTPDQIAAIAEKMVTPHDRAAVWGMALTGMGPGEWYGRWALKPDRIHIDGTKREARVRDIPRVMVERFSEDGHAIKPPKSVTVEWPIRQFSDALKLATGGDVQPYDLRRTYSTWMESAGIIRSRRRQYMGHSTGDVTERYERSVVARFLAEDAALITAWIESQLAAPGAPLTQQAAQEPQQEPNG